MNFIELLKSIPAIVTLIGSVISLVKTLIEKRHDDAVDKLDKSKTKQEAKDALSDVAKHP